MDEFSPELPPVKQPEKLPTDIPKVPEITVEKPPIGQAEQTIIGQIEQGHSGNPDHTLKDIAEGPKITLETPLTPSQKPSVETSSAKDEIGPQDPFAPKTETQEPNPTQGKASGSGGAKEAWERASSAHAPSNTEHHTNWVKTPMRESGQADNGEQTIDMVKGPDGAWSVRSPDDPNFFYTKEPTPDVENEVPPVQKDPSQEVINKWQRGVPIEVSDVAALIREKQREMTSRTSEQPSQSPKEKWEKNYVKGPTIIDVQPSLSPNEQETKESQQRIPNSGETQEQLTQRIESEKQNILQSQQLEGARLAGLVYTPEGQQQVSEVRSRLDSIVEATIKKPLQESDFGWDKRPSEIAEAKTRNNQRMQEWQQKKDKRVSGLLSGERMNNLEQDAYLSSVLGPDYQPGLDGAEEKRKNDALIEQFNKLKSEIGKALDYQRNEIKGQKTEEVNLDEESAKVEGVPRKPGQRLATPMR